jgi:hypothetical protein
VNFYCLGISQIEAEDVSVYYREVSAFRGFNLVDFTAGHRTSHVIIEGDKSLLDGISDHEVGEGTKAKGLLHFFFDSTGQI